MSETVKIRRFRYSLDWFTCDDVECVVGGNYFYEMQYRLGAWYLSGWYYDHKACQWYEDFTKGFQLEHPHIVINQLGWVTKDAQYYGVGQRSRRCFLVASARKNFNPCTVLLESGSLCRDSAPSREPGQITSALTTNGVGVRSADDNQAQAGHLICMAYGQAGAEINDNMSPTLNCNHEQLIIFNSTGQSFYRETEVAATVRAGNASGCSDALNATLLTFPAQISSTQYASAAQGVSQTIQARNSTAVCAFPLLKA